jgi:hypothetical protein
MRGGFLPALPHRGCAHLPNAIEHPDISGVHGHGEVKHVLCISGYAIYYLLTTPGTLMERLSKGIKPVIRMRPEAIIAQQKRNSADQTPKEVELRLMDDEDAANKH